MDAKITAKVETITPEIAKTMLGENVNNRRISRDNVNLFAREIRNGEWRFNGEAIKFGKDGRLLDGQHRLLAVIAALTIKAWNKWRKGKPLRQLKFSAGESFPTPL